MRNFKTEGMDFISCLLMKEVSEGIGTHLACYAFLGQ